MEAESKAELSAFQDAGGRLAVIGRHFLNATRCGPTTRRAPRPSPGICCRSGTAGSRWRRGTPLLSTVADRFAGVAAALTEAGLPTDELPVAQAEFTRDGGRDAAERILRDHPDTTAIVALNDAMAIGVLSALRAHGVPVPHRMSVAGFDDVSFAADLAPGLTTVRLPLAEMGRQALSMALRPPASRPRRKSTGHELVVRDSTGPAPSR
jgi:LacI family transcriptional regulator